MTDHHTSYLKQVLHLWAGQLPDDDPNNFARCLTIFKILSKQTQQKIYNKVMVKCPTIPKSRCYTTLWCIFNHNTCFGLFLFFDIIFSQGSVAMHFRYGGKFYYSSARNLTGTICTVSLVSDVWPSRLLWSDGLKLFQTVFEIQRVLCQ